MPHIPESDAGAGTGFSLTGARVIDAEGRQAQIVSVTQTGAQPNAVIRIERGPELMLPVSLLAMRQQGVFRLPFAFDALDALSDNAESGQETTIPVLQEELQIDKRVIDTGKGVRIRKTVSECEQIVDQMLLRDELVVEHVPVGKIVTTAPLPATRYDGDTLVVPILEEVLVVEKQIRLKEEIRITRHRHQVYAPQSVMLKSEAVSVERFDKDGEASRPVSTSQSST